MRNELSIAHALERVDAAQLFNHCGQDFTALLPMQYRQVEDWATARYHCDDILWENTALRARNGISAHLSVLHREAFRQWNPLIREAKAHLNLHVFPRVEQFAVQHDLSSKLIGNVRWDLLNYCMDEAYQSYKLPHHFFRELFRVYETGHLPCGWEQGEWPQGRLLIY